MEDWLIQTIWVQNHQVQPIPTESWAGDSEAVWPG